MKKVIHSSIFEQYWALLLLLFREKQHRLSSDFKEFLTEVESVLKQEPNALRNSLDNLLPHVFKLRLEFLKILDDSVDIAKAAENLTENVEKLQISEKYYFKDNVLFACRTLQRIQAIISTNIDSRATQEHLRKHEEKQLNYYTLLSSLPSDGKDFLNASLKTELIIIMAMHISEENLPVGDEIITALSKQVVESAQEFYALFKLASEAMPNSTNQHPRETVVFSLEHLKEEKQLADLDLLSSFEFEK